MTRTALCVNAESDLFRAGEVYEIKETWWDEYTHIKTGNYFGDILICGGEGRFVGAVVRNDDFHKGDIYIFDTQHKGP